MDINLNYEGDVFSLKPFPIVWRHTLEMKWGEGHSGTFDRNSGAYPTNVTENVEYFIKDGETFLPENEFKRETHVIDDEEVDNRWWNGEGLNIFHLKKCKKGNQ